MSPKERAARLHNLQQEFERRMLERNPGVSIIHHLALGLASEAGEVASEVKKGDLRDLDVVKIASECADTWVYLRHLTAHLGIDLMAEVDHKIEVVEARLAAGDGTSGSPVK